MSNSGLDNERISAERAQFLDAAFEAHLGAELNADVPGIVATYAEGGHLNFNGTLYDTPEKLAAFHHFYAFSKDAMITEFGGEILNRTYTHDSVVVEFIVLGTVEIPEGTPARKTAHRSVVVYEFNDDGKLVSERAYDDTGGFLAKPVVPRFYPGWTQDDSLLIDATDRFREPESVVSK